MEQILKWLPDSLIFGFTILLLVVWIVPPIFEKINLPGLVGLLIAGVALGPEGLGLLDADSEKMKLFSDIGKIYLMFVAGLEIDLDDFRKKKDRSIAFGIATFCFPTIVGIVVGNLFGMGLNASILVGSLLASQTLLGFPIVTRLGVISNEAVTATVGATIFTDIAALLVLAICISVHGGEFSIVSLVIQLGSLALYSVIVLLGFNWAGKEYFRRTGDEESNQFLFVLLAVFLAAIGAQLINIDKIVGAFLAGLAVNDVVGRSPVEDKVKFVGSTLFIPFFFVNMGLLLSLSGFISTLNSDFWLTLAIVGGLISSKFLAALVMKLVYHYNWNETLTMWSLSLPQVAATLAATLAGVNAGLLSDSVFNVVIVLMLITSILGPILTARFAPKLAIKNKISIARDGTDRESNSENVLDLSSLTPSNFHCPFTIVVPVYNPYTERYLIQMGALLARREFGILIPLSIAKSRVQMDDPKLDRRLRHSQKLLDRAVKVSREFQIEAQPMVRIDDDVARGISQASREKQASLILMGWSSNASLQARLFGNVIDSVFWSTHCPVAVLRLLDKPINIRRLLVPIKNITQQALQTVQFAQIFANVNQAAVTLLHVYDRHASETAIDNFQSELSSIVDRSQPKIEWEIQMRCEDDIARGIIHCANNYDMVVLRSMRRRTAGGLAVSDVTTQVLSELTCSVVLFGEPHSTSIVSSS